MLIHAINIFLNVRRFHRKNQGVYRKSILDYLFWQADIEVLLYF